MRKKSEPMNIDVMLFGPLVEQAGVDRVRLGFETTTVTPPEIRVALAAEVPAIAGSLASFRLAVNHAFAPEHAEIGDGDEVALIGLVSGG
jgi:molybdopterin converting factor small subunit